ncbi:MAG: M23 family metallopeptidase [Acidobacteriota bacterium]|nr:M23 family metallopeptidase [Acidobacteriota bacterium]
MRTETRNVLAAAVAGVIVGAFATAVLVWNFGNFIGGPAAPGREQAAELSAVERFTGGVDSDDVVAVLDAPSPRAATAVTPGGGTAAPVDPSVPTLSAGAGDAGSEITDLRGRQLTVPVESIARSQLVQTFKDPRSGSRVHEAIDILAPRNTPVLAVEDGTVARLFSSRAGGITLYQYDPSGKYVYYYAHLERYGDGLKEGGNIRRGQVLGYVGTSGNAPPNTPHLHFAIFELTGAKRWWEGAPIDPYLVLR